MAAQDFHIAVLLRETLDPRPPAQVGAEGALIRDRGLRRVASPTDLEALEAALQLARTREGRVTALVVGPQRLDDLLRLAHSMGANRALRVWDHALEGTDAVADAALLARILKVLAPSALFTGSHLPDRGDDPAPLLAAEAAGLSWAGGVVSLQARDRHLEVVRKGDRGARQRLLVPLPCVLTFAPAGGEVAYPDLEAVMAALGAEIEVWGLPELGLGFPDVGENAALLQRAGFVFPRPTPLRVPTPNALEPGFDRVRALLSGGIQPREGRLHFGTPAEVADGLYRVLCREGLVAAAGEAP